MHQSLPTSSRQPTLPSGGGLLARGFVYRSAEQTDVRLTWNRARAEQTQFCAPSRPSLAGQAQPT
ncbi:hypothetical protein [Delftia sp. PS-11]|uniref:hypothetical protein n=1 Tax=Delftia sp. PS-11 TaxID=2767222 RepID=UPI0024544F26|nr:hypothetical protein [Delftia sp. PS-11]KAJ8744574.1 hypothetical protein H9T68_11500 [Delftia sp. PS-11]